MNQGFDWKVLLQRAHAQRIYHGSMSFYLGLLGEVREPWPTDGMILEYGATGSEFLRLLHLAFEYGEAVGVLIKIEDSAGVESWPMPIGPRCRFAFAADVKAAPASFNAAFSQEILGLLPDLAAHARHIFALLKPGAFYYTAFGWHAAAPRLLLRSERMQAKGIKLYEHAIEAVAHAFYTAGFEVAVKRLPVSCGIVFHPAKAEASGGLAALLEDVHEHKLLFTCLKPRENHT